MWYCNDCNQQNEGRFCVKCGRERADVAADEEQGSYAYEENENDAFGGGYQKSPKNAPKKTNKGLIIGIAAAAAVVVILGIVAAVMLISADKGDKVSKDSTGIYYYVSGVEDYASLYEENNADSKELVRLNNGAPVEYLDESAPFVYVLDHSSGLYGYMRSDELVNNLDDVVDGAAGDQEDKNKEKGEELTSLGDYYVTGTKNSLSLREEANSDANVIAKLYNGYKLSLLEETNDKYWYVYDYNSAERGYVLKNYLTDDENKVQAATETVTAPASKTIGSTYYVSGTKNYLAIRSRPSSSAAVEIGKTYNGNSVGLVEKTNGTFWYIYDYSSGLYGYVKCAYLSGSAPASTGTPAVSGADYVVSGTTNYLAIRSEPSSSADVEIGKTYNGNIVQVVERTNDTFWYVYDYASGLYGFVKCAYLVQ